MSADSSKTYEFYVSEVGAHEFLADGIGPISDDRKIVGNDEFYVFELGARRYLVDNDDGYEVLGGVSVVYKGDGPIGSMSSVEVATDPTVTIRPNLAPTRKV